nr:retrovirus-related Pol polyprotein from transposon TNT 1-94 [Tanacetum cinerariifolium]
MALQSMRADRLWKKTGKKISIQGTDVAGFDKLKVECFNCHKMGYFLRECRAPRSQDRGRRDNYRQGFKVEEQAPKALMAIDGVGWDWSFMANKEEDHALVADEEAPTEFAMMDKTSAESDVFNNSLCFKNYKKHTESLNSKITDLTDKLCDSKNMLFHYKVGLSQVEGLPEFADDTITDYIRPSPSVESNPNDLQNSTSSASKNGESTGGILSKPKIKFIRHADSPTKSTIRGNQRNWNNLKSQQLGKNFEMKKACYNYSGVDHLSYNCGKWVDHGRSWAKNNNTHKSMSPKPTIHRPYRPPMRPVRPYMNVAQPKRTSFQKLAHSYSKRPFQRTSAVRSQFRAPRVPTVTRKFPTVNRKFPTVSRKFPTGNTKFSTTDLGNKETAGNSQNHIDDNDYWDSGCSQHMIGNISYLSDYEPFDGGYVSFGQAGCKITGKGTIKTDKLEFENMYFVKDLKYNLFSMSQICENKNSVLFTDSKCIVLRRDFKLTYDTNASADECMLWHRRLGHLMNKLVRHNLVRGLPTKCFENDNNCTACMKGKQHKASCKTKLVNSVTKPLHTLHMDLFGPTSVSSLNHKWYCLVVTDDFYRFTWTFFLKTKDETSGILRNFITEIENLKELRVKIIRCDNGGEFRNKEMNDFCLRKGIKREFSNARTPQQNGVAEKRIRTLIEAARTMLADAKLPEAVNTACYVQNRVLVNKSQNKTPYELFNGKTPAIGIFKPFGCHVMILNTLDNLGKFKAKGDEGYFIGYSMSSKAFSVFNKRTKRVEENLHVDFLENKPIEKGAGPNWLFDIDSLTNSMNYVPVVVVGTNSTNFSGIKEAAGQDVKKDMSSLRYIVLPNWFHETHLESSTSNAQDACNADDPESNGNSNPTATSTNHLADHMETLAVETPIPTVNPSWVEAIQEELLQFKIQNVWSLVNCPKGVRPIGTKWVLKNKKDERGIIIRNKARLVAQGHTQEEGIDYDEVFAPVARIEAIRLFLAYASFMGFTVYQIDVKSAFLYGTIDEEVYVMQPPGFQDPEFPARVYKVEKAMYGLHQAPRAWYGTLSKYLLRNGFQRGTIDQTLFIKRHRGDFILVQVYVDDIIFGSSNPQLCRELKALIHEKFQMSAMGELNFFLGLQVLQKEDGIFFSQDKYVGDILKKFRYSDVRSSNTPMDKENPWGKDRTRKDVDLHLYISMIGSLMYLTSSRPDIMFFVCAYARHQVTPKECHLHAVKRIFRYLKGHPKLGLWYPNKSPFDLTIVATSTTEAEYVAATSGCGQVLWIQNQLLDYGLSMPCEALSKEISSSMLLFLRLIPLEYYQFAAELPIERRIELISGLVKYQDHYAKILKYQTQQRKPLSRKQQKEFYMSVLKSHASWKARHFKGMTLEEIKEKFDPVWKQFQDFIPIGSKEEAERFKRKGVRLEQDSSKKLKTSEVVPKKKLKEMMELIPIEEVYMDALQVKHPIIDWEVHTKGERSYWKLLWALVKETLNIRSAISDKEMELWVELKRLYEPDVKEQLWTHTQNLMHAPVEWKLYDTFRVHHVTSKDK